MNLFDPEGDEGEREALLGRVLEAFESGAGFDIESLLDEHSHHAAWLRERIERLERAGMLRHASSDRRSPAAHGTERRPVADRYHAISELGRGGMGVVYLARDERLGREVALKLAASAGDPATWSRFEREARLLGHLEHPGIVPVYDAGRAESGRPFLAMRVVGGRTLHQLIEELERDPRAASEFTVARRIRLLASVCEAIAYAHSRGVVHRDLKPSNVILGAFGEVQVIDWGLAKRLDAGDDSSAPVRPAGAGIPSLHTTVDGYAFGTPSYCSPEQARGAAPEVDERSDVFGLGAMMHHLVTGRPPYYGRDRAEVIERAREGQRNDPGLDCSPWHVPADVASVCHRALALEKDQRYPSVEAMLGDLRALLEDRAPSAHRDSIWQRIVRWVRKRPAVAVGVFASTLVLGLIIVGKSRLDLVEASRQEASFSAQMLAWVPEVTEAAASRSTRNVASAAEAYEVVRGSFSGHPVFASDLMTPDGLDRAEDVLDRIQERMPSLHRLILLDVASVIQLLMRTKVDEAAAIRSGRTPAPTLTQELEKIAKVEREAPDLVKMYPLWVEWIPRQEREPWFRRLFEVHFLDDTAARASAVDRMVADAGEDAPGEHLSELGWQLGRLGRWGEAIPLLRRAVWASPGLLAPRMLLVNALQLAESSSTAQREEALQHAQVCCALSPDTGYGPLNVGALLLALDRDLDEAIRQLERAVRLVPDDGYPHVNLCLAYQRAGRLAEAEREGTRAVGLIPRQKRAWLNLGIVQRDLGQLESARASFERALELDPAYEKPWLSLAESYEQSGELESWRQVLDRAERARVRTVGISLSRARLDARGGAKDRELADLEDAWVKSIEDLRATREDRARILDSLQRARLAHGDRSGARQALEELLELRPDELDAWSALARLQLESGEPAAAVASLWKAFFAARSTDRVLPLSEILERERMLESFPDPGGSAWEMSLDVFREFLHGS